MNPLSEYTQVAELEYKRPAGITALSVLLAISGAAGLALQFASFGTINEFLSQLGVLGFILQASITLVSGLSLASGVGLWLGKRWGWWLALFYMAYAISRNANALLSINGITDAFDMEAANTGSYYFKHGIRILWYGLLLKYLCGDTAGDYFKVESLHKGKALLIVFGICAAILVLFTVIARIF